MVDGEDEKGGSGGAAYFSLESARELREVEGVDDVDGGGGMAVLLSKGPVQSIELGVELGVESRGVFHRDGLKVGRRG